MSNLKLSNQDKKDLDKFTKFFALKAAQIIIQSRLGEKVQTQCKPQTTGKDWVSHKHLPSFRTHIKSSAKTYSTIYSLILTIFTSL